LTLRRTILIEDSESIHFNPRYKRIKEDFGNLWGIYWFIRWSRLPRNIRKHYRRARKEKTRLIAGLGYDQELVRLFCLWLRRPDNERRKKRFHDYLKDMPNRPEQLKLF
jgi:hypothetical protein